MPGGSASVIHHCRRVILDAVQFTDTFVCVTFIQLIRMPLVCENEIMVINTITENPRGPPMRN